MRITSASTASIAQNGTHTQNSKVGSGRVGSGRVGSGRVGAACRKKRPYSIDGYELKFAGQMTPEMMASPAACTVDDLTWYTSNGWTKGERLIDMMAMGQTENAVLRLGVGTVDDRLIVDWQVNDSEAATAYIKHSGDDQECSMIANMRYSLDTTMLITLKNLFYDVGRYIAIRLAYGRIPSDLVSFSSISGLMRATVQGVVDYHGRMDVTFQFNSDATLAVREYFQDYDIPDLLTTYEGVREVRLRIGGPFTLRQFADICLQAAHSPGSMQY